MRRSLRRTMATMAFGALILAGCGGDGSPDGEAADEQTSAEDGAGQDGDGGDTDPLAGVDDPNEDVEDGIYRGRGVVLPVPDGWTLDRTAFAQGVVVATSDDGSQQMTARAVDTAGAESPDELDLESLIDATREIGEPDVDQEVEVGGAERAHRFTFLNVPGQQEGAPTTSGTIILAADGSGLLGEFTYGATSDAYDAAIESTLLDEAGFDPDSEPAPMPPPQPGPQGDGAATPQGEGDDG